MARKPDPFLTDADNPALTDEDLARFRPFAEFAPAAVRDALVADEPPPAKRRPGQRGPGKTPAKVNMTIRVEPETLAAYQALGAGWQARARGILAREAPKARKRA